MEKLRKEKKKTIEKERKKKEKDVGVEKDRNIYKQIGGHREMDKQTAR